MGSLEEETEASREAFDSIERAIVLLSRGPRLSHLHATVMEKVGIALDRPGYLALALLVESGPLRLSDLADRAGVDNSTMSRLAARLESHDLIQSTTSPQDRRVSVLRATARGREAYSRMRRGRREALCQHLEGWTHEELADFARLLSRFTANLLETK
jgi:DNA-binding MarR family transcriptional regulator